MRLQLLLASVFIAPASANADIVLGNQPTLAGTSAIVGGTLDVRRAVGFPVSSQDFSTGIGRHKPKPRANTQRPSRRAVCWKQRLALRDRRCLRLTTRRWDLETTSTVFLPQCKSLLKRMTLTGWAYEHHSRQSPVDSSGRGCMQVLHPLRISPRTRATDGRQEVCRPLLIQITTASRSTASRPFQSLRASQCSVPYSVSLQSDDGNTNFAKTRRTSRRMPTL